MTILLLEDDFVLSKEIKQFLDSKGHDCDAVYDGNLFFKQYKQKAYDVFILDINVPGLNGIEVCRKIRSTNPGSPILMLTAFGEIEDKVEAFNAGADDYLVKPFHFAELQLRIQALAKRMDHVRTDSEIIVIDDLQIDLTESKVTRNNQEINLSPKEYQLLLLLAKANGRVISKTTIADEIWDYTIETTNNTIEVYINFLRKKVDRDFAVKLIHTKPGFGYYLKSEA